MKFRLLSSKREVKIVPISFGLVKKRVAKWPIWSFCYHGLYIYIYIYISYKTARVVGLTPSLKSQGRGLRNPRKSTVCNYNTVCII